MSDLKTIENLMQKSGNEFHFNVAKYLRDKKNRSGSPVWRVLIGPYYLDSATNKSREVDIIAEKDFIIRDNGQKKTILIRLFIECKHVPKDTILWFDGADEHGIEERVYKDVGIKLPDSMPHHYFDTILNKEKVAKLFYSGKDELDNEPIYKGLSQCLSSLVYYKKNFPIDYSAFALRRKRQEEGIPILKIVNYPILIFDDFNNLYRADDKSNIKDNFQIEVNYAYERNVIENMPTILYRGASELFMIDIIKFNDFDKLLERIDTETKDLFREKFD